MPNSIKEVQICQSCGYPLNENNHGTNEDKSTSSEYCNYCFQFGKFTDPLKNLQEMEQIYISNLMNEKHIDEKEAREVASSIVPELKRWTGKEKPQ